MKPDELADHISAILENPDTPTEIYNALAEATIDVIDEANAGILKPEVLRIALPSAMGKQHHTAPARERANAFTWRDERIEIQPLTLDRARRLVRAILKSDDNEEARALVALITGIAYEPDPTKRDGLALFASREAFGLTTEYSRLLDEFATRAAENVKPEPE